MKMLTLTTERRLKDGSGDIQQVEFEVNAEHVKAVFDAADERSTVLFDDGHRVLVIESKATILQRMQSI